MMVLRALSAALAIGIVAATVTPARADIQLPAKPLAGTSKIPCVTSTVTFVGYYFDNDPAAGIDIAFATTLGVANVADTRASITDRSMYTARPASGGSAVWVESSGEDGTPNPIVLQERRGDAVQVCLLSVPAKSATCDPNSDARGRVYRIFDARLHAAYTGFNGNHLCGGA